MNKEITPIEKARILKSLIEIGDVNMLLDTFIKTFKEKGIKKGDGLTYLHGNFNICGTVSGRMSSSSPNLMNLPSTRTKYAKIFKQCFRADNKEWIMVGADFNALEDRINALLTKDPNKLNVYLYGYDSHCFNAYGYWPHKMSDIQLKEGDHKHNVEQINSIEIKYPKLRQAGKTITFAATYMGTYKTFMKNGFSYEEAKQIETNYHKMYEVSDQWSEKKVEKATKNGYTEVAFGLRIRTPILKQIVYKSTQIPYEAHKEIKTINNAFGQSYGLLNNRAGIEFHNRLLESKYKYNVKPICQVHDSQYFLCKRDPEVIKWINDNLIECMSWQNSEEIYHEEVKLGAVLCLYPDWSKEIKLNNNITIKEIEEILNEITIKGN